MSLFVFFEDEFRHVCCVEVGVSVEAAACCEGFEVEFELANIVYEVFVEGLVFHQGIKKRPRLWTVEVLAGGVIGGEVRMEVAGLGLPGLAAGTMRRWWLSARSVWRCSTAAGLGTAARRLLVRVG